MDNGIQNFDDAYYAQKAKEILESGSLWLITYSGIPAFDNPPMPFWLTAIAFSLFGVSTYSAIFSSALFGTGIILITYQLSLLLYKNNWVAFASAFVLLFPGLFVDASRRSMVDIPLAFFVVLAFYAFFKARDLKPWYLVFGLATACAILTKSVLGLFPLTIVGAFLIFSRQWREFINPWFVSGCLIALLLGFSWHLINWQHYGQEFIGAHFGYLIVGRNFGEAKPFYFLGYAKDFYRNYWPWLPIALIGLAQFGKRGFREKDRVSLFLFLWPVLTFLVMSTGKNQVIRYLFMMFPALAIINAKTISEWLGPDKKNQALAIMVGVISTTILFVNVTSFRVKVSLDQQTKEVREIAAIINLNTSKNQRIGSYRLSPYNPRLTMLFYANRIVELGKTSGPEKLIMALSSSPEKLWLTSIGEFRKFTAQYPEKAYLIHANNNYAFFTSMENRRNVRYDFSAHPSSFIIDQKESPNLDEGTFNKLINKDHNNAEPVSECQGAIKQLGSFFTSWQADPAKASPSLWVVLPPVNYYPHTKFNTDLYHNFLTSCGIYKEFGWEVKTRNLQCSDQLHSFKGSVDKLMNVSAVIPYEYPHSHAIWGQMAKGCRDNGLCEFQLESSRYAVMKSYSKIKIACNVN
ncbi:glycosyltransferase family 39 protein [Nitrospinae bacterium]|nr:glycosyltransferase family 39 protein [Nitrospinota bacterium]